MNPNETEATRLATATARIEAELKKSNPSQPEDERHAEAVRRAQAEVGVATKT